MEKCEIERLNLLLKCAKLESALRLAREGLKCHVDTLYVVCQEHDIQDLAGFIGASASILNEIDRALGER